MTRATAAWATFWATFGLIDYVADRHGRSLCDSVRWTFRTSTPAGRLAFTAAYGTGAMILYAHVVKRVIEDLADEMKAETFTN